MLRNVDTTWRKPRWHSVTFILISGRSGKPLTSSNVASNHVDVKPTSQRRAVSPAALFSAAPDCHWRRRFSPFFAGRHIFINISINMTIMLCNGHFLRRITATHVNYTGQRSGWNSSAFDLSTDSTMMSLLRCNLVDMWPLSPRRPVTGRLGTWHLSNMPFQRQIRVTNISKSFTSRIPAGIDTTTTTTTV